ncbi:MAG TPA: hypothetical protein VKK79_23945, partial [Candidatus Lokiarchaeia archaeon]|nr:hypothetical protein [Candidatus Lokiarchaeia archaeon]
FFWTAAAAYGVVLLARAFLSDFSDRDGTHVQFDQTTGTFLYSRRFARKFQHVYFPSAQQASLETRPRKLEVIDIAAVAWLLSLGMLQVCLGWRVADLAVLSSVWEAIISTVLFVTVGFLFIAYFVVPDAHVVVRSASITYTIPVSVNHGQWGALRHLGTRIRGSMQDPASRKSFLLRLGVIAFVVAMTGILAFTPLIF